MNANKRNIETKEFKIGEFINRLLKKEFLIPSFQREFVWNTGDIIKLWDSIYRFFPIGSIICWETAIQLNIHRMPGGFILPASYEEVEGNGERSYILDGQQRSTSLVVSLVGNKIKVKGNRKFDYSIYFDATRASFFFAEAYNRRKREVNERFLIRLGDLLDKGPALYEGISDEPGYSKGVRDNLYQLTRMFNEYKLPFICLRGFDIPAVREIFVRINQEGTDLKSMDLMIAQAFQNYEYMVEDDM